jgi:hypothetical protein
MILEQHLAHHRAAFSLPGVLADPVLVFGFQEVRVTAADDREPETGLRFGADGDLAGVLRAAGLRTIDVLDLFDARANLRHDMNEPIPPGWRGRYRLVVDIGSLEHVFDTRRCLENLCALVAPGGHYFGHVPVNGYFGHGLHVFNPQAIVGALTLNGFSVRMLRYTTAGGEPVDDPAAGGDVLMWIVARSDGEVEGFTVPQQSFWQAYYREPDPARRRALQERAWAAAAERSQSRT